MTDFQALRELLVEREAFSQVLVVVGPARYLVAPQLFALGRSCAVEDLDPAHPRHGRLDVMATFLKYGSQDLLIQVEDFLDAQLCVALSQPWPLTVVQTRSDPRAPVEAVFDWYQGHTLDVLVRDVTSGHLVRRYPEVQALTRRDHGTATARSGEHFFVGSWEEFRAVPFGTPGLDGAELLDVSMPEYSDAILETAGRLFADADSAGASMLDALSTAEALEE